MSKSREKRLKVQTMPSVTKKRTDRKVGLWEKEFDDVVKAIDYALEHANKPVDWFEVGQNTGTPPWPGFPEGLVYWTERISLGGGKWVIKISTWVPK